MKMAKALGWALFVLGVWEAAAPFVLGYTEGAAEVQSLALGAAWASFGLWAALSVRGEAVNLLGWLSACLGGWLVFSPALLGYAAAGAAFWNDLLVGLVAVVLGMWAAFNAPAPSPAAGQRGGA